ncbi:MAG: hypothetical protein WC178_01560 [Candidatus Paceibacterota bacterium]
MILFLNGSLGKNTFRLFFVTLIFFTFSSACLAATENRNTGMTCSDSIDNDGDGKIDSDDFKCDGAVDKENVVVSVSTSDQDNWYNEKDETLHTFAVCDDNQGATYDYSPCNSDGIHDDYYSTDTPNEVNVAPAEKNFTIKVNASDAFGINKIKIEWTSVNVVPTVSDWNNGGIKKDSFTCSGSGSCVVCVQGGECDNDVIDPSFFIIPSDKQQQRFFFRSIITDNNGNSITTGFDNSKVEPILDKFYRFVICSSDCHASSCNPENHAPVVVVDGYDEATNFCDGLSYRLKWIFSDEDADKQAFYSVEVREKETIAPVYSVSRQSADSFCQIFDGIFTNGDIGYGKTYEWRVKVSDDDSRDLCRGTSKWSEWSSMEKSFTTPLHPYPSVSFTIENEREESCDEGICSFLEDINFISTSKVFSVDKGVTYKWYIDSFGPNSVYSTENNVLRKFLEVDEAMHNIRLSVTDSDGYICSVDQTLVLKKSNAKWNEIVPNGE